MGLRLRLLALWTPSWIVRQELEKIQNVTVAALTELLHEHLPNNDPKTEDVDARDFENVGELRQTMAKRQAALVDALADAMGRDTAVKVGREALFAVGERLGSENRSRLGVGLGRGDLVRAAKIMYRVLGIDFNIAWQGPGEATVTVDRCALSENYSSLTCMVLSATDEGVVHGLNPDITMKFEKHITDGCKNCTAKIKQIGREKP